MEPLDISKIITEDININNGLILEGWKTNSLLASAALVGSAMYHSSHMPSSKADPTKATSAIKRTEIKDPNALYNPITRHKDGYYYASVVLPITDHNDVKQLFAQKHNLDVKNLEILKIEKYGSEYNYVIKILNRHH